MELANGGEVSIEARGGAISRAVDTVQVIRTKYLSGSLKIRKIEFDSEPYPAPNGEQSGRFVSSIRIVLSSK